MNFSKKNCSGVYVRSPNLFSSNNSIPPELSNLISSEDPQEMKAKNVFELFRIGSLIAGEDGKFLGTRKDEESPYVWISYGEFNQMSSACAAGLTKLGIESGDSVKIAAYCRMSPEIYSLIFAASKQQNVIVPLYDTLGKSSIDYIVTQATPKIIFCDREKYAENIFSIPNLKATHMLVTFMITNNFQQTADEKGIILLTFNDLLKLGQPHKNEFLTDSKNSLDQLFYIMYTSGSTGVPKGVELTQRNFIANVMSISHLAFSEKDPLGIFNLTYYSYLPFQHSLESLILLQVTTCGGKIGISQGNIKAILSDLKELKPTLFVAVPRVLDRFREKIMEKVNSAIFIKRSLFKWNLERRKNVLKSGNTYEQSLIDRTIFGEIMAGFGGNLRYIIAGGAPLSKDLEIFCRVVLGAKLMQGYGLTETTAAAFVQSLIPCGLDNCGAPLPGVEVKLLDIPELGYSDGFGEICIKGQNVCRGYFKRPDLIDESFDSEGFFRSGDIGKVNANGTFTIIDRCKNIFKLAQGEYIMAEKIEEVYSKHPLVKQIMIYGDSTKDYILGVVILNKEAFVKFARGITQNGHKNEDFLENKLVKDKFLAELTKLGKSADLFGFEQLKGVVLDFTEFTTENELLTPTMKIRRPQITKLFYDRLQSLYNND